MVFIARTALGKLQTGDGRREITRKRGNKWANVRNKEMLARFRPRQIPLCFAPGPIPRSLAFSTREEWEIAFIMRFLSHPGAS